MARRGVLSALISGAGYKSTCENPSEQLGCGQDSHKHFNFHMEGRRRKASRLDKRTRTLRAKRVTVTVMGQ